MLHRNMAGEETSLVINPFEQRRSAMAFIGPKHAREWPYPGQLWRHDHIQVIVVAVSPNTVSYEDLSRGTRGTESMSDVLATFRRIRR
jgi:hypothetical protein